MKTPTLRRTKKPAKAPTLRGRARERETSEDADSETDDETSEGTDAEAVEETGEDADAETDEEAGEDTDSETNEETSEDADAETDEESGEGTDAETDEETSEDTAAETDEEAGEETGEDTDAETNEETSEDTDSETDEESGEDADSEANEETGEEDTDGDGVNEDEEGAGDNTDNDTSEDNDEEGADASNAGFNEGTGETDETSEDTGTEGTDGTENPADDPEGTGDTGNGSGASGGGGGHPKHTFEDYLNPENYDENGKYIGEGQEWGYKPYGEDSSKFGEHASSPELAAMSAYMAEHNYGRGDAAEYRNDPEWQRLNENLRQADEVREARQNQEKTQSDPWEKLEQHNLFELPSDCRIVPASEIDMSDAMGMDDPNFWNHHANTKEDYMRLAEKLPDVQRELDSGKTLQELRQNPELRDTVSAYYDPEKMIHVQEKPDGGLEFIDDGRHRVAAAQELGWVRYPSGQKGWKRKIP